MMMIVPIVRSHYLCLPNKMFESIQSEVPVIASDLPEMVRVVNEYNIGLTCHPGDTAGIAACIRKMIEDRQMYEGFKTNLAKAKDELCWECEKLKLMEAFRLLE